MWLLKATQSHLASAVEESSTHQVRGRRVREKESSEITQSFHFFHIFPTAHLWAFTPSSRLRANNENKLPVAFLTFIPHFFAIFISIILAAAVVSLLFFQFNSETRPHTLPPPPCTPFTPLMRNFLFSSWLLHKILCSEQICEILWKLWEWVKKVVQNTAHGWKITTRKIINRKKRINYVKYCNFYITDPNKQQNEQKVSEKCCTSSWTKEKKINCICVLKNKLKKFSFIWSKFQRVLKF